MSGTKLESKPEKSLSEVVLKYVKYIYSTAATLTYLVYIHWGIWTNQAVLPVPPVVNFLIFWFCMTLVAYLEGLQVAILAALENASRDLERKKDSHPRAYKLMKSVMAGNNVDKFLVGRQFFTIFVMTLIAQVTSFPDISHLNIPGVVWFIFISTGLPGAMVVTTIASLQPQLLAAKDPWNFMNLYGSHSVLNLCYGLEWTGICTHYAWMLINILKRTFFVSDVEGNKEKKDEITTQQQACEVFKYILSAGVVLTYFSLLMFGIWTDESLLGILGVPPVVVFIIFGLCFVFLAHLEGLQVAILVRENKDPEENNMAQIRPRAYALMKRALYEKNVRRFLIGRQFFVIFVVFLINQCTIFPEIDHLGVPGPVWFTFVQLGFPTALNVLCWAQLPTQLLANYDPMLFLNRPGPRFTLEVCLFTEMTGIAHSSWVASSFSLLTWYKVYGTVAMDEISAFKDLNAVNDGKSKVGSQTEDVTSEGGNNETVCSNDQL